MNEDQKNMLIELSLQAMRSNTLSQESNLVAQRNFSRVLSALGIESAEIANKGCCSGNRGCCTNESAEEAEADANDGADRDAVETEETSEPVVEQKKRTRRTKAQIEADNAKAAMGQKKTTAKKPEPVVDEPEEGEGEDRWDGVDPEEGLEDDGMPLFSTKTSTELWNAIGEAGLRGKCKNGTQKRQLELYCEEFWKAGKLTIEHFEGFPEVPPIGGEPEESEWEDEESHENKPAKKPVVKNAKPSLKSKKENETNPKPAPAESDDEDWGDEEEVAEKDEWDI